MEPNIKKKTDELARALATSETYAKLLEAREQIEQHEAATIMLNDLVKKQNSLQEKLMQGEQPSESDIADYQRTAEIVGMNPYVRSLLEAEMAFSEMMMQVQRELAQAVGLDIAENAEPEAPPEPIEKPAQSRLWVPGQ